MFVRQVNRSAGCVLVCEDTLPRRWYTYLALVAIAKVPTDTSDADEKLVNIGQPGRCYSMQCEVLRERNPIWRSQSV